MNPIKCLWFDLIEDLARSRMRQLIRTVQISILPVPFLELETF